MKVVVLGPLCKDRNVISGKKYEKPGGVTYYTGIALSNLGVETIVLGTCGSDAPPWPEGGVACLERIPAAGTIEFINEYGEADRDSRSQRAVVHDNTVTPEMIDHSFLRRADFIVLGPLMHGNITPTLLEHLAAYGRLVLAVQGAVRYLRDGKIVWDNPQRARRLLPYCEYVALDENELRFISGRDDLDSGAKVLFDCGASRLIVTRGSRGSVLYLDGKRHDIPAYPPTELADPTGAGDSYLAGFIRSLELFDSPQERGRFAAMTATISMEHSGAFEASTDEVLRRLHSQ